MLTALLAGYLALRRLDLDPDARSTWAAVLGLLLVPNVVVVNRSVPWWRSLHQDATLARIDPTIEGDMLVALMVGFLAIGLVFTWLDDAPLPGGVARAAGRPGRPRRRPGRPPGEASRPPAPRVRTTHGGGEVPA